jgi:hypothetical protein
LVAKTLETDVINQFEQKQKMSHPNGMDRLLDGRQCKCFFRCNFSVKFANLLYSFRYTSQMDRNEGAQKTPWLQEQQGLGMFLDLLLSTSNNNLCSGFFNHFFHNA